MPLRAWRRWVDTVPDEVTSVGRFLQFPPIPAIPEPVRGKSFALVAVAYWLSDSINHRLAGGEVNWREGATLSATIGAFWFLASLDDLDVSFQAYNAWHSVQASGPVYSAREGWPFVGHQPEPRTRSSVGREMLLDCGDCARLVKAGARKKSTETPRQSATPK